MFIALKPCTISGKKYLIDDKVDTSMLSEKEIAGLLKKKFIVKTEEDKGEDNALPPAFGLLSVPVITKDDTLMLPMTGEQLCEVVTLIQGTAKDAIDAIKGITEEAPLILLHRLDSRSSVQEAAKKRAEAITAAPPEDDENSSSTEDDNGDPNPPAGDGDE